MYICSCVFIGSHQTKALIIYVSIKRIIQTGHHLRPTSNTNYKDGSEMNSAHSLVAKLDSHHHGSMATIPLT